MLLDCIGISYGFVELKLLVLWCVILGGGYLFFFVGKWGTQDFIADDRMGVGCVS